jgi:threonine/homoserine/homoserine lactone efflux protein
MDLIIVFLASLCAGIILGAPVGVAGAMVADAALAHSRKRLYATILAAALGDASLAAFSTIFSSSFKSFLRNYEKIGLFTAGLAVIIVGVCTIIVTFITHRGIVSKEEVKNPSSKWIISHFAPVMAAFLTALLHPGNIAAFLTLMTVFSLLFPDFVSHKIFFISGIFTGSFLAFSLAGFLFWKIRKKADRYVHYLRYTLAVLLIFAGVCLVMCNFKTV